VLVLSVIHLIVFVVQIITYWKVPKEIVYKAVNAVLKVINIIFLVVAFIGLWRSIATSDSEILECLTNII